MWLHEQRHLNQLHGLRCQAGQCYAQCGRLCRTDENRRRSRTRHGQHSGLETQCRKLLNIAQLFVPAVRNSSVQGYQSGLTVQATGSPNDHCGYSGGYVGSAYGAQIQLNGEDKLLSTDQWASTNKYAAPVASCNATNLRRVTGRIAVGGYVGLASAGSVARVNTNASNGLLQGILDHLISAPGDLVKVLQATATTIHAATVSAADSKWGFVVDGAYKDGDTVKYAAYAGGFAGSLEASAVGEKDSDAKKDTGTKSAQCRRRPVCGRILRLG